MRSWPASSVWILTRSRAFTTVGSWHELKVLLGGFDGRRPVMAADGWDDAVAVALDGVEHMVSSGCARVVDSLGLSKNERIASGDVDRFQPELFDLAFAAAEIRLATVMRDYAAHGELEADLARVAVGEGLLRAQARLAGHHARLGLNPSDALAVAMTRICSLGRDPSRVDDLFERIGVGTGPRHLAEPFEMASRVFAAFAADRIAPVAEKIHREDLDVPEAIIQGLAELGAFGLSVPEAYGGSLIDGEESFLPMVVASEELSRASFGAAGSLITRPEILTRALLGGGTESQRRRWLPRIASGNAMVAVAVTEPDTGSDVSAIKTRAIRDARGWLLRGTKMWCTFAGRAELLLVLARSDPDPALGHRGLSLFVIEKRPERGHEFELVQPGGGAIRGTAIPTLGYRGMHSFEVQFDDWVVPQDSLIGGDAGEGLGFYHTMDAFAVGRLQTAARAVGVSEGAFAEAIAYSRSRHVFGKSVSDYRLPRTMLVRMAARIQSNRQFVLTTARQFGLGGGQREAAMAKVLAARTAEAITRDALQLHGGYGYAEEYPVSRHFVDARVLSLFEGTEEVLALRVIAPQLLAAAQQDSAGVHVGK